MSDKMIWYLIKLPNGEYHKRSGSKTPTVYFELSHARSAIANIACPGEIYTIEHYDITLIDKTTWDVLR